MRNLEAIELDILNCDGSCRDLNFAEEITLNGVVQVLDFISSGWALKRATDDEGKELKLEQIHSALLREKGGLSTVWEGNVKITSLQVYIFWEAREKFFFELTFFPDDLEKTMFKLDDFLLMVSNLVRAAGSREYYLRYENASWRHGSIDRDSGVIFSHHDVALPSG